MLAPNTTGLGHHQLVLPVLIVTSRAATKSDTTASTWSSPARTFMISELGLEYFLERTEARKAVMVFAVSLVASWR